MSTTTNQPSPQRTLLGSGKRGQDRVRGVRTRNRSRSLITLAALLVVGFGLLTAAMVARAGDKTSVLTVGTAIAKGHTVERGDLVTQSVSGVAGSIPVDDVDSVLGKTATVDLVKGQILTESMLTAAPTPGKGQAVVGLSLDPTRVPSEGLDSGDVVDVIPVPGGAEGSKVDQSALDTPTVLTSQATVYSVKGLATDGGQVLLTLVVDQADANKVAAYSTSNQIALVEVDAARSAG